MLQTAIPALLLLLLQQLTSGRATSPQQIERWGRWEQVWKGPAEAVDMNPFTDVDLEVPSITPIRTPTPDPYPNPTLTLSRTVALRYATLDWHAASWLMVLITR